MIFSKKLQQYKQKRTASKIASTIDKRVKEVLAQGLGESIPDKMIGDIGLFHQLLEITTDEDLDKLKKQFSGLNHLIQHLDDNIKEMIEVTLKDQPKPKLSKKLGGDRQKKTEKLVLRIDKKMKKLIAQGLEGKALFEEASNSSYGQIFTLLRTATDYEIDFFSKRFSGFCHFIDLFEEFAQDQKE